MKALLQKHLSEIAITKYIPFKIRGRIGGKGSVQALIKAEDDVVGEMSWVVNLSSAGKQNVPKPTMGLEFLTEETFQIIGRSLSFSQKNLPMGRQNAQTNVSIPFFSTMVKFLTYFIEQEKTKTPIEDRTGMISFSAVEGGTATRPDINARDRVYLLIAKQLEQQGLCTVIRHSSAGFTVLINEFVDRAVRANLMRRV